MLNLCFLLGEAPCICDYPPPWSLLKITPGILIFTSFRQSLFMGFDFFIIFLFLFIDVDLVSGLVLNFVSVWLSVDLNGIYLFENFAFAVLFVWV